MLRVLNLNSPQFEASSIKLICYLLYSNVCVKLLFPSFTTSNNNVMIYISEVLSICAYNKDNLGISDIL